MTVHFPHEYLKNPVHKVTIDLVGIGGTGSQVLTALARMNEALVGLGKPGLHVRAWDIDTVTPANMGRQLFSPADLGENKASVLITRINRFFGYSWQAMPELYKGKLVSNILITCVDSAKARLDINDVLVNRNINLKEKAEHPTDNLYYWLDIGNLQKTGQVVLGTMTTCPQPKTIDSCKTKSVLPTVVKKFPQLKKIKEVNQGPSCSLAEALEKQDLFINSTLSQFGCNLIWKLFKEEFIKHQGCYVNLETMTVNPIKL